MVAPKVVIEIGNKMGVVEDVKRRRQTDDQNLSLQVRVALPISKPLRRGGFLMGSDGQRHWLTISIKGCQCYAIFVGF